MTKIRHKVVVKKLNILKQEYTYDDNGNLISEDRHRAYETQPALYTNIRRYEYTKDNKLEAVYSGSILLAAYTYDGDGIITSTLDRDLDLNQNLNINDHEYLNRLTNNQRQLINKGLTNDSLLYELTEYVTDKNRPYSETLMERDGTGQLSLVYTYGNQRLNAENYNDLTGIYTYDGRGSVSAVIGSYGDFRASYWYDGFGNVKSQIHGYGAFGSGKKYYGYNAEQYSPITDNQNLRNRQLNIRRQRFLTEDTYLGNKTDTLSINRYIYARNNPLKYLDPNGDDYIGAMWLLNEKGAATAGHAAIMLIDDEGQGEFYSYAASDNNLFDKARAFIASPGYLSTVVNDDGNSKKINVLEDFIENYDSNKQSWYVEGVDGINNKNKNTNKNTNKNGDLTKDYYTYAVYIPITNDEGIAMQERAEDIRNSPGWYNLFGHNCNQVAQNILSAGGKDFDSQKFSWLATRPNSVRDILMMGINSQPSIVSAPSNAGFDESKVELYRTWEYGRIGDLEYLFSCIEKLKDIDYCTKSKQVL